MLSRMRRSCSGTLTPSASHPESCCRAEAVLLLVPPPPVLPVLLLLLLSVQLLFHRAAHARVLEVRPPPAELTTRALVALLTSRLPALASLVAVLAVEDELVPDFGRPLVSPLLREVGRRLKDGKTAGWKPSAVAARTLPRLATVDLRDLDRFRLDDDDALDTRTAGSCC